MPFDLFVKVIQISAIYRISCVWPEIFFITDNYNILLTTPGVQTLHGLYTWYLFKPSGVLYQR